MLTMARNLLDPRTRQATAFYAALAVTLYDIATKGFQPINAAMLAGAAGITVLGTLAALFKQPPKDDSQA
jgi:uncharacterized membrane protein YjjB (DUF3815 family)